MLEINDFNAIRISLASPEEILSWSHGEVTKPETINYRTLKPERDGLFCERIFGPTKDWECYCGKYKRVRYKGIVCDKCGVEVARSKVRRERMGHIQLASPVSHIWFVKGTPSRIGLLMDISPRNLERVLYFAAYIITDVDELAISRLREQIREEYAGRRAELEQQIEEQRGQRATELSQELAQIEQALQMTLQRTREAFEEQRREFEEEAERIRELLTDLHDNDEVAEEDIVFRGEIVVEEGEPVTEKILADFDEMVEQEIERMEQRQSYELESAQTLTAGERDHRIFVADEEQERLLNSITRKLEELNREEKERLERLEDIRLHRIISENEYRALRDVAGYAFRADMGAGAIREIVSQIDLETLAIQLQEEIQTSSGQRRKKATKRLRVVEAFRKSGNKPEWMILTVLPVIPPDLRPMVQLDGGRFATSDLNDLYRRVINRNNRLKKLMELNAPEIIVRNEKRMLQEAVDALIDNGRRGRAVSGKGKHRLKSLSDMLKGKQGRFRQNLLGKRVDYSGRSVIVVGPTLQLHQCGLPKKMALELFKPFVMRRLVEKGHAHNIKSAKRIVERVRPEVWDVLEEVIKDYLVLLNRAPSLHRLSIQAFEAVLIEGSAIQLHPLVCAAFNADFDGDQMAVHVPLSRKAQEEARTRMLSKYNLLSPAHGDPIITPSQDIVLGCYYLTQIREGAKGAGKRFASVDEALLAHTNGVVHIQAPIWVCIEDEIQGGNDRQAHRLNGNHGRPRYLVETSVGRIIFNSALYFEDEPPVGENGYISPLHYRNRLMDKKGLKELIADCYRFYSDERNLPETWRQELINRFGNISEEELLRFYASERTAALADRIKALGFKHATLGGMTMGVTDIQIPAIKRQILEEAENRVAEVEKQHRRGLITEEERYREVVKTWQDATKRLTTAVRDTLDPYSPVAMMSNSGARGNIDQIRQMAGMRGLMSDPTGRIIELPIRSNFREGLSVLEYFVSTHGGRKGLADTALRTADAGYLTRRLVDVAQDVIVTIEDCGTGDGLWIREADSRAIMETLGERITGRIAAAPIVNRGTGETIVERNQEITEEHAAQVMKMVEALPAEERQDFAVFVRSVLACQAEHGVCRRCYGRNLATGKLVQVGEAVGIIAAQSIGEPGTQLTLRTFHTGGIAGEDITQGLPRVQEIFEARTPKGKAILAQISGAVEIIREGEARRIRIVSRDLYTDEIDLPANYRALVEDGEQVAEGQPLAESNIAEDGRPPLLARIAGVAHVRGNRIEVVSEEREEWEEIVPHGAHIRVEDGEYVEVGQQLTEGPADPHEMLILRGRDAVQSYLVVEAQKVYRSQGVPINDKHIEIIIRQMMRRVRIEEPGDTDLLPGELVDTFELNRTNAAVVSQGGNPALGVPVLLGITKASLTTDSFLSAASFQETTRVLTEAAITGKVDYLRGLKENVVIGKLIPAGTGLERRRELMQKAVVTEEMVMLGDGRSAEDRRAAQEILEPVQPEVPAKGDAFDAALRSVLEEQQRTGFSDTLHFGLPEEAQGRDADHVEGNGTEES
ncbi:MAG: DNA-directed RNA polymerase subunit beta' [Herpetosiphonaceae bacterium]|nr:MAG: DNA-directed RNA polymerase subunit beta' [Herpetosiphonaceae bacterium]